MRCTRHPSTQAITSCGQCSRPFCAACLIEAGRVRCHSCAASTPPVETSEEPVPLSPSPLFALIVGLSLLALTSLFYAIGEQERCRKHEPATSPASLIQPAPQLSDSPAAPGLTASPPD